MKNTIRIHPIRMRQLEELASSIPSSVPRVVEWIISHLMETGQIPERLQEFSIDRDGDAVTIALSGHELPVLSVSEANRLGAALSDFLVNPGLIMRHELPANHAFVAQRAGQGIRLSLHGNQAVLSTLTLTGPILFDVLRRFESLLV